MVLRSVLDGLASVIFAAPCRIFGDILSNASRIPVCDPERRRERGYNQAEVIARPLAKKS
jgi:hypothetical protein